MTATIVLAAGESSRMGRPKLSLELEGEPLLARAVRTARSVAEVVVVVIGAHETRYRPIAESLAAEVVVNPEWQRGIGSSLRLGVAAVAPMSERTLVTLADMPFVTGDHLRELIRIHRQREASLVFSRYRDGRLGVPALLHRSRFESARSLPDDRGARALATAAATVAAIDLSPRQEIDIDTPDDAAHWSLNDPEVDSAPPAGG